ncbi:C-GCAxxG-C-C family (seleno)protein [Shewanella sp. A32]|uniref:C-GCAxxG-C-C family (seleno)protein n=1 Tax=Shewanella sp. A32 TaxID=3031327 RepID=UPI0023B9AAC5|nr:C-GCAxxG-C-C family (seleno)protein [Shewanella sp. A32]MDF0534802.1 C-GCAxxG-C-C family (seleno)protein [Shewanella sp. A32]
MMNINRRQAMGQIIGLVSVAAGGGIMANAMAADTCAGDNAIGIGSDGSSDLAANLLTYVKVDPLAVAKRAYEDYGKGGCMYGVFDAIVKELAAQGHEDACKFAAIPTNITVYGGGGVSGWGSLCGCVNAAAMAVNMLAGVDRTKVIRSVYHYYESTSMPRGDSEFLTAIGAPTRTTNAGEPLTAELIGQSVAKSILCHTSVTLWSKQSKFGTSHAAKLERCAQVTAEVAYITADYLNKALDGTLDVATVADSNSDCGACHSSTKREPDTYFATDVNSQMECQSCHSEHDVSAGLTSAHADYTCSDCH